MTVRWRSCWPTTPSAISTDNNGPGVAANVTLDVSRWAPSRSPTSPPSTPIPVLPWAPRRNRSRRKEPSRFPSPVTAWRSCAWPGAAANLGGRHRQLGYLCRWRGRPRRTGRHFWAEPRARFRREQSGQRGHRAQFARRGSCMVRRHCRAHPLCERRQLNVVAPYAIAAQTSTSVRVEYLGASSPAVTVPCCWRNRASSL